MNFSYKSTLFAIVLVLLTATSPAAFAQVHKCTDTAGKVTFSDQPCERGTQGGEIVVKPNEIDTSASRESALRSENAALQERLDRAEAAKSIEGESSKTLQGSSAPAFNAAQCVAARRNYEFAASSITKSEGEIDAQRSAMYVACNTPEPERTIINVQPRQRRSESQFLHRPCVDHLDFNCVRNGVFR